MARKPAKLQDRIVDEAIALAEQAGWGSVRLRVVAERLGVKLTDVAAHYRELEIGRASCRERG